MEDKEVNKMTIVRRTIKLDKSEPIFYEFEDKSAIGFYVRPKKQRLPRKLKKKLKRNGSSVLLFKTGLALFREMLNFNLDEIETKYNF